MWNVGVHLLSPPDPIVVPTWLFWDPLVPWCISKVCNMTDWLCFQGIPPAKRR